MSLHLKDCRKNPQTNVLPMNVFLYRKYVVPESNEIDIRVWDMVCSFDDRFFVNHTGPRSVPEFPTKPTHPLVNMGYAYWVNSITICKGYVLWKREHIFRPIYSTRREKYIYNLLKEIRSIDVQKLAVWRRLDMAYVLLHQWDQTNYIKTSLGKRKKNNIKIQLPKEMIRYILNFLKF